MSLTPFFSLTANNPSVHTYDPSNPNAAYATGWLYSFGGHSAGYNPLQQQASNDEVVVGYDPVAPGDQTINSVSNDFHRRCTVHAFFKGDNVSIDNQYLLLVQLRGFVSATAQFFIGTELVREEHVSGHEQVAMLIDVPGSGVFVPLYIRLASSAAYARLGFSGLDCYLL